MVELVERLNQQKYYRTFKSKYSSVTSWQEDLQKQAVENKFR